MLARDALFMRMARDVGVKRHSGETDDSFFTRVAYTGSRYWVSAFCMDDGAGGTDGLTRQALNRRLKTWIGRLSEVRPSLGDWFEANQGGVSCVYNRLINIEEIVPNGFSGRFLAQPPRLLPVSKGHALIIGMADPTVQAGDVLGHDRSSIVASGLASLVSTCTEPPGRTPRWWETEWGLLQWARASEFDGVEYANPKARSWSLGKTETWSPSVELTDGIAIARTISNARGGTNYYAVRGGRREKLLCLIDLTRAYELYYFIRKRAGNPVVARLQRLDDAHIRFDMPLRLIPGEQGRVLEAISWPMSSVSDSFRRIARAEAADLVGNLLAICNVALREA